MSDSEPEIEVPPPLEVAYCLVTGIPAEFNDFLPKDTDEYKRWKVAKGAAVEETGGLEGDLANLTVEGEQRKVRRRISSFVYPVE